MIGAKHDFGAGNAYLLSWLQNSGIRRSESVSGAASDVWRRGWGSGWARPCFEWVRRRLSGTLLVRVAGGNLIDAVVGS